MLKGVQDQQVEYQSGGNSGMCCCRLECSDVV